MKQIIDHKHSFTFNELFDEYINVMAHTMSDHTLRTKISYYNKHFKENLGHYIITDFKFKNAQLFVNYLLSKDLKPKTVKNIVDIFKVLYKYAIMNEYCEKNPFEYVQIPQFDNKIYFNFTEEEIKRFIKTVLNFPDQKFRALFTFLLHGRRLNEVLSLTWDYVDFKNKVYFIPPKINKAKRLMEYQMTDILYNLLTNQKLLNSISCPDSNYVFPSNIIPILIYL